MSRFRLLHRSNPPSNPGSWSKALAKWRGMRFENYSSSGAGAVPHCLGISPPHCAHCTRSRKEAAAIEDGYDYRHLIGDAGIQRDKVGDVTRFAELRTDYDRILIRFGMCIVSE